MSEPTGPAERCGGCGSSESGRRCSQCGVALRAGAYQIERVLAQTPHSRTYVAKDSSGKRVALKELLFATVPTLQQLEAFEREARLLEAVEHPQVPRFVGRFTDGEASQTRMYLAQELIEGASLSDRLRAGTLDEAQARDVAAQVLTVLDHLHTRTPPLIHRDLKPHNLIARPDGAIVVVDFGAARELTGGATHQATLVGTYGYMPPEQLAGTVDETSDLYALGATLMHLLSGKPPEKLIGESLELGEGLALNVTPAFDRVIRRLCAKPVSKRFPSAQAALEAMRALPPQQKRKAGSRAALMGASAGLLFVAAGIGVVVAPTQCGAPPIVDPHASAATAWVAKPKAVLYEAPNLQAAMPPGGALPIGTELKVERVPTYAEQGLAPRPVDPTVPVDPTAAPQPADGFIRVFAPVAAYVRAVDLTTDRPEYHAILGAARSALADGELAKADTEANRAQALRSKEREPLQLLGALYDAQARADDARRIAALLSELGPAPASPPAKTEPRPGPPPAPGERWFVGATKLRIRKKAAADAAVLAELPINSELEIVSLAGEWAQVKWTPRHAASLEFALNVVGAAPQPPKPIQGFVAHPYLVRDRVEKDWTLSKADAASKRNDGDEVLRMLARAAALDPLDRPLQFQLARAAVAVRDYPTAAYAAVAAAELSAGMHVPLLELRLAAGCRGERARAQWIDDTTGAADHAPADACVETFAAPECAPCDCGSGYYEEFERPAEIASRRAQLEEAGIAADEIEATLASEFPATPAGPSESEQWQSRETKRGSDRSTVVTRFADGPWLRIRVTGPARAAPGTQIIVYQFSAQEELTAPENEDEKPACASRTAEVTAIATVPVPARGQDVTLWVRVPLYEGTYGVEFAATAEEVAQHLQEEYSACGSGEPANVVTGTPDEAAGCDDCQCT